MKKIRESYESDMAAMNVSISSTYSAGKNAFKWEVCVNSPLMHGAQPAAGDDYCDYIYIKTRNQITDSF